MFDNILVPMDGSSLSELILPHAAAMARVYRSEVTLLSVMDPSLETLNSSFNGAYDWQIRRAEAKAYLDGIASSLKAAGIHTHPLLLEGNAPETILSHSAELGINLVMLSSHGERGISGWGMSSVPLKIIEHIPTSVMIVRSHSRESQGLTGLHYRRLLAPMDGSTRGEGGIAAAAQLARAHDAELLLVQVVKPAELSSRIPPSSEDRRLVQRLVDANLSEAKSYLDGLIASLDCRVDTRLLVSDHVTEALHTLVEQENIDLVILNAQGWSGNPGWRYGNVAINFLTYGTAPLLIVQGLAPEPYIQDEAEKFASQSMQTLREVS